MTWDAGGGGRACMAWRNSGRRRSRGVSLTEAAGARRAWVSRGSRSVSGSIASPGNQGDAMRPAAACG